MKKYLYLLLFAFALVFITDVEADVISKRKMYVYVGGQVAHNIDADQIDSVKFVVETIEEEEEGVQGGFSLKFNDRQLKNNEEVIISEYEVDFFTQMVFSPVIVNNVDDFVNISITEERVDFDPAVYHTQMCIDQCMVSNGEKTQDWGSFELAPGREKRCDAHFVILEDKKAEAIKATVKYIFSDGKTDMEVNVKYDYQP